MRTFKEFYTNPSVFSKLFFAWLVPLVRYLRGVDISVETLPDVPEELGFYRDYKHISENWDAEKHASRPSFFKAVWRSRKWEYALCALFMGSLWFSHLIQAVLLYYLVRYLKDDSAEVASGCLWGGAIVLNQLVGLLISNQGYLRVVLLSSKLKSWSCMMVAKKLLVTSNTCLNSRNEASKATNVIGNDIELLEFLIVSANLPSIPLFLACAAGILYNYMGTSGLLGLLLVASQFPLMICLGKVTSAIRMRLAKVSDTRVRMISNLVEGIKVVKLYAWEAPLLEMVFNERAHEIREFLKMSWVQISTKVLNVGMIAASAILPMLYFVQQGNELSSEVAFLLVSVLSSTNTLLNYFGAMGLRFTFLVLATFRRITEILLLEETRQPSQVPDFKGVRVVKASFTWEPAPLSRH